jgi:hypothetical protein
MSDVKTVKRKLKDVARLAARVERRRHPLYAAMRRTLVECGPPKTDQQRHWLLEFERCVDGANAYWRGELRKQERAETRAKLTVIEGDKS